MSQPDQQHKLLPQPGPWCRGGSGPSRGRAKRPRLSSVLPPPRHRAGAPALPRRARRPRPAPRRSAAAGVPRERRRPEAEAAPTPGPRVLSVADRSAKRRGAEGSWRRQPLPPLFRGERVPWATLAQEMGGKSAARRQRNQDGP